MPRILLALIVLLLLPACGNVTTIGPVSDSLTREQALAQLDQLRPEPGTDAATFAQLKDAMRRSLLASSATRFTSATPSGAAGSVTDLQLVSDNGTLSLEWTYTNRADYDQNRQVNIADLSTLGAQLGKGTGSPDWLEKARVADGDLNGLITISDITPIGGSLLATVDGYWVQSSTTPSQADSWTDLEQLPFEDSVFKPGNPFKQFSFVLDNPQPGTFYRVRPYNGEELGPVSNYVEEGTGPPSITDVQPQGGDSGSVLQFVATLDGSAPEDYAWDFGGGATPNTTIDPSPTVTLGAAGDYSASVTVTSDLGSDTFDFTLEVTAGIAAPVIDDVQPRSGFGGGGHLTMVATLSGGAPDTYAWDFGAPGGEITPNTSSEASPEIILGPLGDYNASLTVGNAGGSDTFNFVLTATTMSAPPQAPYALAATDGEQADMVQVSWVPDLSGTIPDDYEVFRADNPGGPFGAVGTTTDTYFPDVTAVANVQYWYYVEARKSGSFNSPPSNTDSGYAYVSIGGSWQATALPGVIDDTATECILIDCNGVPAIGRRGINPFFYAQWNKAQNAQGTLWNAPDELSSDPVGDFADLAVVGGKPALLLNKQFAFPPAANYLPANDADGLSWGIAVECHLTSLDGTPRLAEVSGHPAFTYGSANAFFKRANDASGTSWPASGVQMHTHELNGRRLSFFPGGRPFSVATWVEGGTTYYSELVTADDPLGETWINNGIFAAPLDADNLYIDEPFFSAGRPWVSALHDTAATDAAAIMFANNGSGSNWPVVGTDIPNTTEHYDSSFAIINGRPAVIVVTNIGPGQYEMNYIEATDNVATGWASSEFVLDGPQFAFPHLVGIGVPQRPAVAFMYNVVGTWAQVYAARN